ncbi:hypothetical protein [Candidatus Marimicrobium litorale]|uniref:Guanylate cyclase domain-containing protein n=1 Tax=Candidatus Marimicrobium litorale TaxID=2518991 RepID=A0ABT3T5T0_9GAMM|nr:hypothetical protein [Candidatus Marimicrobium litorale]MCX2977535.1 hypothetical protein [Candidatus Marimicrobium litorale]
MKSVLGRGQGRAGQRSEEEKTSLEPHLSFLCMDFDDCQRRTGVDIPAFFCELLTRELLD